jgi:hypothetical protein
MKNITNKHMAQPRNSPEEKAAMRPEEKHKHA